jgi:hypothetical protein
MIARWQIGQRESTLDVGISDIRNGLKKRNHHMKPIYIYQPAGD